MNIKEFRKQRGLSQKALGERVGISQAMVAHLEGGVRVCSGELLLALSRELGVGAGDIVLDHPAYVRLQRRCRRLTEKELVSLDSIAAYFIKTRGAR